MMDQMLCFVVGRSNFGTAVADEEVRQRKIRRAMKSRRLPAELLGSYRNTGNYAFAVEGVTAETIAEIVGDATRQAGEEDRPNCGVIRPQRAKQHLEVPPWPGPRAPEGRHPHCKWRLRWTPASLFLVEEPTSWRSLPVETGRASVVAWLVA